MKVKDEKEALESILNKSPNDISNQVPLPGDVPEIKNSQPTMGINFAELKEKCNDEARIMLNNSLGFVLTPEILENKDNNSYIKNKLEVDIMSLSGMLYQLRVNEAMQKAMMEEVDKGFIHPRMFEVFGGLSKTIAEINKQLLGTVEAIKHTYKDIKNDIQEKKNDMLGAGNTSGMLTQGDGSLVTMGTKELINSVNKRSNNRDKEIQDIDEIK